MFIRLVVHGLQESSAAQPTDQITDDIKHLSEIILPHFPFKKPALQFVSDFNMNKLSCAIPPPIISVFR